MAAPKKLGLLLAGAPGQPAFQHGVKLAAAALARGVDVYVYCIDEAVTGVSQPELQALKDQGLKLFACAYGAHQRHLPLDDQAVYSGLTMVSELMASTDRFVCFS